MASIRYTISSLAAFGATVPGTTNSYDLDKTPENLANGQLPALICEPEVNSEKGYRPLAYSGGSPAITLYVRHILLYANLELAYRRALPGLMTFMDSYIAATKANPNLNTQAGPPPNQIVMQYTIDQGWVEYGDGKYHSITFRHMMELYL